MSDKADVKEHAQPTDNELVAAWKAGDRLAGDLLLRRHEETLIRFLSRGGGSAEDLMQETLLRCTRAITTFRGDASFRTFLLGVAANVRRDHHRKSRALLPIDEGEEPAVDELQVDVSVDSERQAAVLRDRIADLPPILHEVIALQYWSGLSSVQIGQLLNINAATVRRRQADARRRLAVSLRRISRNN